MSNQNGYIGRSPGDSAVIIASQTFEPTGVQTNFTFASGYTVGYLDVYFNGARLVYANDYTATDGSTVGLTTHANNGDVLELVAYKSFNVGSVEEAGGNFSVGNQLTVVGHTTATTAYYTGIVTATTFYDSSGVALASTANVSTSDLFVVGVSTLSDTVSLPDNKSITLGGDDDLEIHHAGGGNSYIKNNTGELEIRSDTTKIFNKNTSQTIAGFTQGASVGITTVGILTAYSNIAVGLGATIHGSSGNAVFAGVVTATTFKGDLTGDVTGNVTGNADTATTSTNAQGLTGTPDITVRNITGVAATFTGAVTYEDVTNVDSIGIVTARGGLEVGAAGVGGTISSGGNVIFAGITTVGTGLTFADNIEARFGNAGDLRIYHDASHSRVVDGGTGGLKLQSSALAIDNAAGSATMAAFTAGGEVQLRHNNGIKFETLSSGVKVTGVTSTTSFSVGPGLLQEKSEVPASALTGTVNFDIVDDGMVHWHYTNASGTWVVNLRGDASTTFNSIMDIGKTAVFTLYSASNNTSYYMTDFQIDGVSMTERWNGGSAPSAGTGSGTDVYTFNIFKTGDAAYTVYATFSNFA